MDDRVAFAKLVAKELADGYATGRYAPPPEYLNTNDAAAFLGLTPGGMETMRKEGRGPAFIRASGKLVRYRVTDLNNWMAQYRVEPGEVQ